MKYKTLVIFCLICLVFTGFGIQPKSIAAAGSTYYVSPMGKDSNPGTLALPWLTPQKASNTAVAGDTVYFRAGSYVTTAAWTFANSGSATGGYITYTNYPTESVTITGKCEGGYWSEIFINKNYIKFIGLNFTGDPASVVPMAYGMHPDGADHIIIQNCTFHDFSGTALYPEFCTNLLIDDVEIWNDCISGFEEMLSIVSCDGFEVKNCKIHDPAPTTWSPIGRIGIVVKNGSKNGSIHHNEVYNLTGIHQGSIYIDGEGIDQYNIDVYNNLCHANPGGPGLALREERGVDLPTDNYDINFFNNVVYNCGTGFELGSVGTETFTNCSIINNTFYNCGRPGAYDAILWVDFPNAQLAGIIIRNNIFYATADQKFGIFDVQHGYEAGKIIITNNLFYNSVGTFHPWNQKGTSYVTSDPKFNSIALHDFSLQSDSPAKDAGSANNAPPTDYIGTARPQGAGFDIGAYEKINSTSLAISTSSLPNGTVGTAYSQTLAATGGTVPYTWTVNSGTLPAGLSLSSSGVISGTPTTTGGPTSITFQVNDSTSATATKTLAITINGALPSITTSSLPNGTVGAAYSQTLAATGGTIPYTWAIASGTLPAGLSLSSSGVLSGTPTTAGGPTSVTFRVTDSASATATKALSITINSVALTITTSSLPNGTISTAYSQALAATGGTSPYTWTITSGTLPAGLSLSSIGVISGTPTTAGGPTSVTFRVTDSTTATATKTLTIGVAYAAWDINKDGIVNVLDMISLSQHWGESGTPGWIPQDVNSDGVINTLDMIIIGQHWTG